MLYITQLIYIKDNCEEAFLEFESKAIPLLQEYGGKVIQRIRPTADSFIEGEELRPYEIHIVSMESKDRLKEFANDPRRQDFIHLKDESVSEILMFMGEKV
ncbi:DUF1330 domain-containing protein [Reichenbachiella versicolor]|uniref:DUF1330 domain-containing protein n=1 Tax=Reichenbachiella versicolor TaxID=1821036 RepID=UPI000D6E619E|nr:DUF1330 domain-containing protein [Reichenbachiella versicolor]